MNNYIKPILKYGNQEIENSEHINIAYGVDVNFMMPMGVSITSILKHNLEEKFVFYILTDNIEDIPKDKIKLLGGENALLKLYDVDEILSNKFKNVPISMNITKATWYRFLLADVLYGEDKVLYIDADIICQNSIKPLYLIDMLDNIVATVKDRGDIAAEQKQFLQIENDYFNAGVMLIDLLKWRENNIIQKSMDYFSTGKKLRFLDQDVLNKVLDGKVTYIKEKYNFFYWPEKASKMKLPDDVVLVHFTAEKPWWIWIEHKAMPLYLDYKKLSPWKNDALPLPNNYKQCKSMSKYCRKHKCIKDAVYWYMRYCIEKLKYKMFR